MYKMQITDEEAEHILDVLKASTFHAGVQNRNAYLDRTNDLIDKIRAHQERQIPVVHYHFYTGKLSYQRDDGTWEESIENYDHSPCGVANSWDPTDSFFRSTLTKVIDEVTCKKCRHWLHLEPMLRVCKSKQHKTSRNITLEL